MNFDIESHSRGTTRSVTSFERDGKRAHAVTVSRSYGATLEDLWDAVTNAERIPRWFLPVSGELRCGGRYQLEGNAGGAITDCVPLSHFALTWEFGEDVSWVDVSVAPDEAGGARLTLTHTANHSEFWDEYGPGATGVGWELAIMGLAMNIAHPTESMPEEEAFVASLGGNAFIAACGEGWAQAAMNEGEDADAAQAAAARVIAFYTGESSEPS